MTPPLPGPTPPPAPKVVVRKHWTAQLLNAALGAAIYLGVGALVHVIEIGDYFDQMSLRSWGTVLAWPAIVVMFTVKWLAIILAALLLVALVCFIIWFIYDRVSQAMARRDYRRMDADMRDKFRNGLS